MKNKIPFPVLITGLVFLGLTGIFVSADNHISNYLESADENLLLLANHNRSSFWDAVMKESSSFWFWIPFYCFLLLRLVAYNRVRFSRIAVFILFYLLVSIGSLSAYNTLFGHLRPFYDQALKNMLEIGPSGPGDAYGCIPMSSIVAGLAFLLGLFFGRGHLLQNILMGLWALLVLTSRAYNGWNYPREIISGSAVSILLGYLSFITYRIYLRKNYAG
ncbi:hypothetical protein [Pedobacter suwonensis]|uniref:hypothetical protein n=1 Tax=Pedobacter suwonensis TaxID=332999 RepID=UPI0036B8EBFD